MIQYSTCENNSSFPLIENIVTAQHIGFYENFWMENCMHVSVNGSGKVGDRVCK
ncbi:hypothetical protein DPMN_098274 [Dreissena polymorpha]|uniref:Uncharacterized protein n=1 Tax=Dreissena polymorpha TaxID=45954 RepID=A0A9D4R5H5_DREPO|nr:hypothetical protein DPMN_098274 [Dreissena polymorpha]